MLAAGSFAPQILLFLVVILTIAGCGRSKDTGPSLAEQIQKAQQIAEPSTRAIALVKVSSEQRSVGDLAGAEASISAAAAACEEIEEPADRAEALNAVVEMLAKTNYISQANSLIREVRESADQINDPQKRIRIIARMAQIYGRYLDKQSSATGHLRSIESSTEGIKNTEFRVEAMMQIASAYWLVAAGEDGQRITEEAIRVANSVPDDRQHSACLAIIATALRKSDQADASAQLFGEAEQLASQVEPAHSRAYAFVHLARQLHSSGDRASAQQLLHKAELVAADVTDPSLKGPLLTQISEIRGSL